MWTPYSATPQMFPLDRRSVSSPGAVVGCYEIQSVLGRGSTGVVVKAHDRHLDRLVAIKFCHPDPTDRVHQLQRFASEVRLMASIRHEHVAAVHDFGEHEGSPYLVMEYVEGENLAEQLRRRRGSRVVIAEALAVLDAVCAGIHAVHSAGAVHGDLKPANVLLGRENRVVVSDFGTAWNVRDRGASSEAVHGTPAYLAPEYGLHYQGGIAQPHRADLYSLGVIAFELLTGRPPFVTEDAIAMLHLHATEPAPRASDLNRELPIALDAVFRTALAKEPEARHATVQLFQQALRAASRRHHRGGPA